MNTKAKRFVVYFLNNRKQWIELDTVEADNKESAIYRAKESYQKHKRLFQNWKAEPYEDTKISKM